MNRKRKTKEEESKEGRTAKQQESEAGVCNHSWIMEHNQKGNLSMVHPWAFDPRFFSSSYRVYSGSKLGFKFRLDLVSFRQGRCTIDCVPFMNSPALKIKILFLVSFPSSARISFDLKDREPSLRVKWNSLPPKGIHVSGFLVHLTWFFLFVRIFVCSVHLGHRYRSACDEKMFRRLW